MKLELLKHAAQCDWSWQHLFFLFFFIGSVFGGFCIWLCSNYTQKKWKSDITARHSLSSYRSADASDQRGIVNMMCIRTGVLFVFFCHYSSFGAASHSSNAFCVWLSDDVPVIKTAWLFRRSTSTRPRRSPDKKSPKI